MTWGENNGPQDNALGDCTPNLAFYSWIFSFHSGFKIKGSIDTDSQVVHVFRPLERLDKDE